MTDLSALRDTTVLLTGGAGLVGSHVADLLVDAGAKEVRLLDDLSRGRRESLAGVLDTPGTPVRLVVGDVRDRALLAELSEGADILIHLAALRLTLCAEQPRAAMEVMVDGMFNVFEAAVNANVKRVVAASSASVYGNAEVFPIAEDHHPYGDHTIYGAAKLFSEGVLRSFQEMYNLNYMALRYFNVFGPRMDIHGAYTEVLVRWMERIENGEPPLVFGDGKDSMDFVYVGDIARATLMAATSDVSGRALNIASGVETNLHELAAALLNVMGSDLPVEHAPARALTTVSRRLADTEAAAEVLGFRAEVGLEEGLARLVEWWRTAREEGR